jgi:hypothetical protein
MFCTISNQIKITKRVPTKAPTVTKKFSNNFDSYQTFHISLVNQEIIELSDIRFRNALSDYRISDIKKTLSVLPSLVDSYSSCRGKMTLASLGLEGEYTGINCQPYSKVSPNAKKSNYSESLDATEC